jgi:hypothetical protein
VRESLLSYCLKTGLIINLLILTATTFAQVKNFKENQVIQVGREQSLKIIKCRGEGAQQQCEVVYYVNNKQVGNSFWLMANQIRQQHKNVQTKVEKNIAPKKIEERKVAALRTDVAVDNKKARIGTAEPIKTVSQEENKKTIVQQKDIPAQIGNRDTFKVDAARKEKMVSRDLTVNMGAYSIVSLTNVYAKDMLEAVDMRNESQIEVRGKSDAASAKRLGVFIDCNADCDMNYIRTELPIVDFLLDRNAADVHVLINQQTTGSGGKAVQLIFYGQQQFSRIRDTLTLNVPPASTEFERRVEILKGIKRGLIPFLLKTPFGKFLEVTINTTKQKKAESTTTRDPWDSWIFLLGANGTFSTDQVYKSTQASSYISAERTTDKLKISFSGSANYNDYKYDYTDPYTTVQYDILNRSYLFQHFLIASLGKHIGIGYEIAHSKNTFYNNKSRVYGKTGIEYSIFPYKDVNTRFFTIGYFIDVRANKYFDTTIYFLTRETLLGQLLNMNMSFNQKWGTVSSTVAYSNFFKDASINNLSASFAVYIRITGGVSFNTYLFASRVQDQIYLSKGAATLQDILARGRQLASKYNLSSGFGLTFRFGSKLNNFVNPRMQSFQ